MLSRRCPTGDSPDQLEGLQFGALSRLSRKISGGNPGEGQRQSPARVLASPVPVFGDLFPSKSLTYSGRTSEHRRTFGLVGLSRQVVDKSPFRRAGARRNGRRVGMGLRARTRSHSEKRMGWDSNPRTTFAVAGFQDRCIQPLCHPSSRCHSRCHSRCQWNTPREAAATFEVRPPAFDVYPLAPVPFGSRKGRPAARRH